MSGSQTGDAYARLAPSPRACTTYGASDRPDALLFVDIDAPATKAEDALVRIRELPYGMFLSVAFVIVRAPTGTTSEQISAMLGALEGILQTLTKSVRDWAVLEHRLDEDPTLHWRPLDAAAEPPHRNPDNPFVGELLRRARGVELSCMLEANHAVWRPRDYHFRLPDGSHASSFVRIADGISGPRDAHALATWLMPDLTDGRGVVFDNRTMTPVALAVEALFADRDDTCGPILFLEHAPQSQAGIERLVRDAGASGSGVLGVISVSSGGSTRDRLAAAMTHMTPRDWAIHTLADRQVPAHQMVPGLVDENNITWLGYLLGGEDIARADNCPWCLSADMRRVVAIDPRFFDGMVLPDPTMRNIAPAEAQRSAPLWEACDEAAAVTLEHDADAESRGRRARPEVKDGHMGVFVDVDRLIAHPTFVDKLTQGLRAIGLADQPALKNVDLIIVPQRDHQRIGFDVAVATVAREIGAEHAPVLAVDAKAEPSTWPEDTVKQIKTSRHLLVLASAAVTGYTLQRLLVGCQEHLRAAANPEFLSGLLLHARLATLREWSTLYNSYGQRLFAVFDTPLPIGSPLRDEAATLSLLSGAMSDLPEDWRGPIREFTRRRSVWANGSERITGAGAPYRPLLWGMPEIDSERARIRQHSLFGHKLGPAAFMAAIGSAVHRERQAIARTSGPVWQQFEMPALMRSYYDPLIIAAMLRWVRPAETWWGPSPATVINALMERATEEDRWVLVPEVLLAAAQGKVHVEAADQVLERADAMLRQRDLPAEVAVAVAAASAAWQVEKGRRAPASKASSSIALPERMPAPRTASGPLGTTPAKKARAKKGTEATSPRPSKKTAAKKKS